MTATDNQPGPDSNCGLLEPSDGNLFVSAYPPFSCWTARCNDDIGQMLDSSPINCHNVPLGLYVHIPFCLQRCEFCYYRSYADPTGSTIDSYIAALTSEIRAYSQLSRLAGRQLSFAYFGGGTPSLLSTAQLESLFSAIQAAFPSWSDVEEVTFECSPRTVTSERMDVLRRSGVTRISMGVQQMNNDVLRKSGRVHLVDDVRRAFALIREREFDVTNIDLMVGLVGETDETFFDSLEQVISMAPDSITFYQLEVPPNTPLARAIRDDEVSSVASWGVKRTRLSKAFSRLETGDYALRSAYAAVRKSSGENNRPAFLYQDMQYRGADLVGTGLASFSYVTDRHYQNVASLREYNEILAADRLPYSRGYVLNDDERMIREFVLQLKLGRVETDYFRNKFGINLGNRFSAPLKRFSRDGLLSVDNDAVVLSRQGLLRIDRMLPEFYLSQHRDASYW